MNKITVCAVFAAGALLLGNVARADDHRLNQILAEQDDKAQTRYGQRHPKETLEFFGIESGMSIAEALPGGGWYSKILLPYLGEDGSLLGIDYAIDMWSHFGDFATAEFIEKKKSWPTTWTEKASDWAGDDGAKVAAATFSSIAKERYGTMDAVLFIRALHNLARFQDKGNYLDAALSVSFKLLKPGGIVGIVQHEARENRPDAWADGSSGYLKKTAVIKAFETAGFKLVGDSDINANEKDQAKEGDVVWRLPPTLGGAEADEKVKAKMSTIGESNRMTLKFIKPEPAS